MGHMNTASLSSKIVSVTDLRRNFGEISNYLTRIDSLILTKGGEPFAIIKALPAEKMKILRRTAGVWKNTALDNDKFWKETLKKKSRKGLIRL